MRQYRNMAEYLIRQPLIMDLAEQALLSNWADPAVRGSIRGGTDGAMLSEKGSADTPNLSVGQHNIHSVLEFVSLDEMVSSRGTSCRTGRPVATARENIAAEIVGFRPFARGVGVGVGSQPLGKHMADLRVRLAWGF